jgi:hypothetical protein
MPLRVWLELSIFVLGTVDCWHLGIDDVRLLLGVIIVGYGPALLANAFRAFRKEPEEGEEYWWERLVDLVVLPFIGGWVTATMISILPALAGTTMAVANHVNDLRLRSLSQSHSVWSLKSLLPDGSRAG